MTVYVGTSIVANKVQNGVCSLAASGEISNICNMLMEILWGGLRTPWTGGLAG